MLLIYTEPAVEEIPEFKVNSTTRWRDLYSYPLISSVNKFHVFSINLIARARQDVETLYRNFFIIYP
jgi:hypothetical protein